MKESDETTVKEEIYSKARIVNIREDYYRYLKQIDSKIANLDKEQYSELRPFIGILFKNNGFDYFAPLSSPKPKFKNIKNTSLDLYKLDDGKLGAVNLNNMIPVKTNNYYFSNLNISEDMSENEKNYIYLLNKQLDFINENIWHIRIKANKLFNSYVNNVLNENIAKRCSNFALLEAKCHLYNLKIKNKKKY